MAIVEEKKDLVNDAAAKESGCCGGASKEAAKAEELQGDVRPSTKNLDLKVERKDKEQGKSCCG